MKYTPFPACAGVKFTDPVPLATSVPVKTDGAVTGVTTEPFVTPLTSDESPLICRAGDGADDVIVIELFCEMPPRVAVSMTGVLVVTVCTASTMKLALFDPAGTLTEDGTVTSEVAPLTTATVVLLVALPDKLAVHDVDPGADTVAGAHARPKSTGAVGWVGGLMVTVPPVPLMGRRFAFPAQAITCTNDTEAEVSVVLATWNVIVARVPLAIAAGFIPATRQRMSPNEIRLQATDLLAALPAAPLV